MHPASSWTALGQVVAALLSLPSLLASAHSPLCSIFLEVVVRADATETFLSCPHAGRYYCLANCPYGRAVLHWYRACVCEYRPYVREYRPVFLWFRRICLCYSRRASWPAPGRSVRARDEPMPPSSGDFVASRDGVLALIRDELQTLQSQLMPENPLQPVPYVAGGSQSGELFTPVGWARVFDGCVLHFLYCFGPCVLANWAICQLCRHGCFTPIFWLRSACTLVTVFACWFAHVFHVCMLVCPCFSFFIVLTLMG